MTGRYEQTFPGAAGPYLTFAYQVIRVWRLPAGRLLAGGLGVLPLAPIGAVTEAELPGVIDRLKTKLAAPRYRGAAGALWTAVDVLMGLRYDRALVTQLLQGVRGMKESVTYQAIVEEGVIKGRLEEARRIVFRQGEQRFGGPAGAVAQSRVESINSLEALERLTDRLLQVHSWEELLTEAATPGPQRGRRKGR